MVNPIPTNIRNIWDNWNIRGLILFSLSLQIALILFAPLRKSFRSKPIKFLIWSAYLLADWAATFGVGLIADRARDNPYPSRNNELLAFWAPFMLIHLGGPDSITAFALADNELWLRHLLGLIFQAVGAVYVFLLTLPGNKLSIPTVLIFIAGTIKYSERIRALYLASVEKFRASTLREGEEIGGIEHYAIRKDSDWDWNFRVAYHHFAGFRTLFVDLSVGALKSFYFFEPGCVSFTHEDAFRIIEIELSLAYQVFHTKIQVIQSVLGIFLRFICFGSVVVALSVFYFQVEKNSFDEFDVRVTYTLLLGAIALDIIAFFMLVFSDGTFVSLLNYDDRSRLGKIKDCIVAILRRFLFLKSTRWESYSHSKHKVLATRLLFRRWSGSVSGFSWMRYWLGENPSRVQKVESKLGQCMANAINGCVNTMVKPIQFLHIHQVFALPGLADIVDWIRIEASLSHEPLTKELWEILFEEIKRKNQKAGDQASDWRKFFQTRNTGVVIEEMLVGSNPEDVRPLVSFIKSFPREDDRLSFVDSVVLWHLVTEYYFYQETTEDRSNEKTSNAREVSKILSDYIMYLFVSKVSMMNFSESLSKKIMEDLRIDGYNLLLIHIGKDKLKAAWEHCHPTKSKSDTSSKSGRDTSELSKDNPPEPKGKLPPNLLISIWRDILHVHEWEEDEHLLKHVASAYIEILEKGIQPPQTSEDLSNSKSRFAHGAIELVAKLDDLKDKVNKWDLISKVWVELLSNASIRCSGTAHVQQLSNGGELLTFVWLLLHYFNIVNFNNPK